MVKLAEHTHRLICGCHQGFGGSRDLAQEIITGLKLRPAGPFPRSCTDKVYKAPDGKKILISVRGAYPRNGELADTVTKQLEAHELDRAHAMITHFVSPKNYPTAGLRSAVSRAYKQGRIMDAEGLVSKDEASRQAALEDIQSTLDAHAMSD